MIKEFMGAARAADDRDLTAEDCFDETADGAVILLFSRRFSVCEHPF